MGACSPRLPERIHIIKQVADDLQVRASAPVPHMPAVGSAEGLAATTTTTDAREQGSSSTAVASAAAAGPAAAAARSHEAVARLLAAPPSLSQLMRLCLSGFPDPHMERR